VCNEESRVVINLIAVTLLTVVVIAEAQQPAKVPRIAILIAISPSAISARTEAFCQGLRELGYVEGKNIVIEYRQPCTVEILAASACPAVL